MKKILLFLLATMFSFGAAAQKLSITGKVIDKQTSEAIELASVQLLNKDSSYVSGINTDKDGAFKLSPTKAGSYIVKITYIGYNPSYANAVVSTSDKTKALGTISMETSDIALKMAKITAKVAKVEMKEDTFVYNAAAYRVPEGSTLESLIEKLPGVEVDDDGSIKANGKTVTQIMVNGKDFFKGDTKIAMKNLPVSLVDKVKAYDKKSDFTKTTGIDDGNEETVLDLALKKELKSSWVSNIDLGYGTKDRYTSKLFINRFTDNSRVTAFGSMNNVNDQGFRGGGGGFRNGGSGLTASKMFGMNGMWNNGKKDDDGGFFEISGNARYSHSSTDRSSHSNSETFLTQTSGSSFSNNRSASLGNSTSLTSSLKLQWKPDSMTTIQFEPNFSYSENNNKSISKTATFNNNPYLISLNPLDDAFDKLMRAAGLDSIMVNTNELRSMSDGRSHSLGSEFQITRKFGKKGRNVSFSADLDYSKSKSHSYSISNIEYFQKNTEGNVTAPYFNNQYSNNPSKNWNYSLRLSYNEPLTKNLFLQARYRFQYKYSDSNRSLYYLSDSLASWSSSVESIDEYLAYHPLGTHPTEADSLAAALNFRNSQYATYKYYNHDINLGLRWVTDKMNLSAGVSFKPETTKMHFEKNNIPYDRERNVYNIAPDVNMRYRFTKYRTLNFRYRGSSSQPSMTNLLDITDDSNPLNISMGNPDLKPSWTNNLSMFFNDYQQEHQQSFMANIGYSQTNRSISSKMTYDETTGVRTTKPENINGNWNANGSIMFNRAVDSEKAVNVSTFTNATYTNSVGYVSVSNNSQKNTTRTINLGERLRASYRGELFEVGLNGSINYQHSRNKIQSNGNLDTYNFNYGASLQYNFPWNMSLSTDIGMNSRRGYSDASMNTNELLWNAQLSYSFLTGKPATISVQCYDLLHQQSNVSRNINAQMRSDSWNNAINSYVMVHFIYRLNIFGSNANNSDDKANKREGRGERPEGMPMMRMGGSSGGFSGGKGGRGGF